MEGCGWPANPDVGIYIKFVGETPWGSLFIRLLHGVFARGPIGSFHQQA